MSLKSLLESLIGQYQTEYIIRNGVQYTDTWASVDWVWIASAVLFTVVISMTMRLIISFVGRLFK